MPVDALLVRRQRLALFPSLRTRLERRLVVPPAARVELGGARGALALRLRVVREDERVVRRGVRRVRVVGRGRERD